MAKKDKINLNAREVFDDPEGHIPYDIDSLTPEQLRQAHSYWVTQYTYCSAQLANIQIKIKRAARNRDWTFKAKFLDIKQQRRMSNEEAKYRAELSKAVKRATRKLAVLESQELAWQTLTQQCDDFRRLCSRDQSWRETELEATHGKGGRGK